MDELLLRQMPHSVEAEQSVLGSMLIDSRCIPEVIELLKPDDFYMPQNKAIFETIYMMFGYSQVIDPVTVLDQMRVNGSYDPESSGAYMMSLMDVTPTAANVREYVGIVRDKALLRNIATASSEISALVMSGAGEAQEIMEAAERKIYAIRQGRGSRGIDHISTILLEVYEQLSELAKSGDALPGLSTGFTDLDAAISGLRKSDLVMLASRPGMGKTSLALNIALHAGKHSGRTVVFFSLEMSKEQLVMRLLSSEALVNSKRLVTGKLSFDDWANIASAAAVLSKTDIRIDDNPSLSVAEMNAKCRRVDNLGLVVIDYLQLMQSAGNGVRQGENRQQVVSDISRSLKIMAKELSVPVLCLSQLSRANETRADKRPILSDLRESGSIEQDADCVLFLYRDDYYKEDSEEHNAAECIIAKNRHGETGKVELQWLPQYTSFSNKEWKHDDRDH